MAKARILSKDSPRLEFDGHCERTGPNGAWCFLAAPFDVLKTFGTKARVPVRGAINGFALRSSLCGWKDATYFASTSRCNKVRV